jgi:hypothetical protein
MKLFFKKKFEAGSRYVAPAGLKLTIFLSQPPKCWLLGVCHHVWIEVWKSLESLFFGEQSLLMYIMFMYLFTLIQHFLRVKQTNKKQIKKKWQKSLPRIS